MPEARARQHPGELLTSGQRVVYILVLGALTALGPFTTDLYLPAFPAIQADFGVDASAVQLTLTGTMIGFGLGQLIVGPLSDKIGRKGPLIGGAVLHVAACVFAAIAPNIVVLGILRVLMGFGAASSGVVSMAMIRDLFGGKLLVRMMSRMALVNGFAPVIAPVVGSQLLSIMNWHGIFWVLAGYGALVSIAVVVFVVETLPKDKRSAAQRSLRQRYSSLFHDRIYVGALVIAGMNFTGLFAYLSTSPFLFQEIYGLSAQMYGVLFAVNSLGIIIGVQTSSRLMQYGLVRPGWILAFTTGCQLALGVLIFVLDWEGSGIWGTAIPLWFYIAACGFTFPTVQILALSAHGEEAGTAASMLGAVNFGIAGALSPIVGLLGVGTAMPMAGMMAVAAVIAIVVLWSVVRPRTVPAIED